MSSIAPTYDATTQRLVLYLQKVGPGVSTLDWHSDIGAAETRRCGGRAFGAFL